MPFKPELRRSFRWLAVSFLGLTGFWGCADDTRSVRGLGGSSLRPGELPEPCAIPAQGCPCDEEGATAECGETMGSDGDQVTCSIGRRTCEDGSWSSCSGSRLEQKSARARAVGLRTLGQGERGPCPEDYEDIECDPYCYAQVDEPDSELDVPPNFDVTPEGLTIVQTGAGTCESIELTASSTTMTVTALNPVAVREGNPITLRVAQVPTRCLTPPFAAKYVVDAPDRARATGTLNTNGTLELLSATAGPLVVTAYAGGRSDSVTIDVRVRIVDTVGVPPDVTGGSYRNDFYDAMNAPRVGSVASTATWLYPYEGTYFPLGLLPPVIQYKYSAAGDAAGTDAVRLSLRYPAGSSYEAAAFDYALVLTETNSVHRGIGKAEAKDPQLVVPPAAWDAFEETARGNDATLSVERRRGDGVLEAPVTRNIHFVNGQLKGTVLYNSYNSTIAGSTSTNVIGGVLRIAPGQAEPSVAVPATQGKCSVCHSVSSDGSTLVLASGDGTNGSGCSGALGGSTSGAVSELYRGNSCSFDVDGPAPLEIATYPKTRINQYTFVWSALYPDGSFALTNAWNNLGNNGDKLLGTTPQGSDYRASSLLARLSDGDRLWSESAPNMAVTPTFSHDGRKVAFNVSRFADLKRDIVLSEIGACDRFTPGGLVISEVSACQSFAGTANRDAVEIRNESTIARNLANYTIRGGTNGTTACSPAWTVNTENCGTTTVAAGESLICTRSASCLSDEGGRVQLYDAAGTAVPGTLTSTYSSCSATVSRLVRRCDGSFTTQTGAANDASNDRCGGLDSIELRNETGQDVNIGGWQVFSANRLCATVPSPRTIPRGRVWQSPTTNTMYPDCIRNGDEVVLYDAAGNVVDRRTVQGSCGGGTLTHPIFSCERIWWTSGIAHDPANDDCSGEGDAYSEDAAGTALAVMDFSCGAPAGSVTCSGSTKTFSDRTTVASHTKAVGNPSFLPDNAGLVFQRVVNDSDFESSLNSAFGGASEIWLTSADNTGPSAPFAPRRLDALNGYDAAGNFLQTTVPRDVTPGIPNYVASWHSSSPASINWYFDQCFSDTPQTDTASEGQLNYFPTASPQEAGDQYWVLFTSRRLYGNVATSSPWQAERSNQSNRFGPFSSGTCDNAYGPASGLIETKKLWVSAIDKDWQTSGRDPSHPAFYLPGQELQAGNSHAYWVATPCSKLEESCETDDDCCGGTGASATNECRITQTVPNVVRKCQRIDSCSSSGEQCSADIPCCQGLVCPAGGGVCQQEASAVYEEQEYEREYVGECPAGMHPKWLEFGWKATLEAGTSIDFEIQTRPDQDSDYEPGNAIFLASAAATTAPDSWDSAESSVDELLVSNGLYSQEYLLVTMTFHPDDTGARAPTLNDWRLIYDCLPAE